MDQVVGGVVTLGLGLFAIAAIYQLGKSTNPIVPDATQAYNNTLTGIFK